MDSSSDLSTEATGSKQKSLPNPIFHLVDPTTLRPHPLNFSIYGDAEDVSALVELIRASEWVRPLVINQHNNIISGHRRCMAVQILGWKTVPVEVREFPSEEAELEALLLENASREKTREQKVREAEAWERVERAKAKQRQQLAAAMTNQKLGKETNETLVENFPQASKGKSRDKVAKLVGLGSGRNYAKAKKVVEAINELKFHGDIEGALDLRKVLNEQSVDAALKRLKKLPGASRESEETTSQKRSCWNCQHYSRESVKDNHSFYCNKFGILTFLEKDGDTRGAECHLWSERQAVADSANQKTQPTPSNFTLTLPGNLQPIFEDAARAAGMSLADWACYHLLQAASPVKATHIEQ